MDKLHKLEEKIEKIESRNRKVENDKAWETSYAKRFLLFFFTYVSIGLYLNVIQIKDPWLNAIVPSIGFFLSTLTLPFFKSTWLKKRNKR